jgi:hypothetical protein
MATFAATCPGPVTIAAIRGRAFRNDQRLIATLETLLAPSYETPAAVLERDIARCDTLYLRYDTRGEIAAFFLVSWESIAVDGLDLPSVYLGLSATRQDTKNSAIVRELYDHFLGEASAWEDRTSQRLVLWYTTATPSACFAAYAIFADAEPRMDGGFTERTKGIATALRAQMGLETSPDVHPYVLKALFDDRRYSSAERERISQICRNKNFTLLDELGVSEECGDRLLYICFAP